MKSGMRWRFQQIPHIPPLKRISLCPPLGGSATEAEEQGKGITGERKGESEAEAGEREVRTGEGRGRSEVEAEER